MVVERVNPCIRPLLVGEVGADPTVPEDKGFMVLETRIELEIYAFENLDCFLLVQFAK